LTNKRHIKIGNQIRIRQNDNKNYNYVNNVKNNINIRNQRGKSKCVSVEINSSLKNEKSSHDKSQSLKVADKVRYKNGCFFLF